MKNFLRLVLFVAAFAMIATACHSLNQEEKAGGVEQLFPENWKFQAGEGNDSLWASVNYNDSAWSVVSSLKLLSDQHKATEQGFGWYRTRIVFTDSLRHALQLAHALVLHLGPFAAADEVDVNGKLIGKTGDFPPDYKGYHDEARNYLIPMDYLNMKGENQFAIKFHDGWGKGGFLGGTVASLTSAGINDKILLHLQVEDSDNVFLGASPLRIQVRLKNSNRSKIQGVLYVKLTTDTYEPLHTDSVTVALAGEDSCSGSFQYRNPSPGFYRYQVYFCRNGKNVCEQKINVGYEPEKISSPNDAKADFKHFWQTTLSDLARVKPRYQMKVLPLYSKLDYTMYEVRMYSLGNELIRGYYAQPKQKGKFPVIVEYMGYGSLPYRPTQTWDGFAHFVLSVRGQGLNLPENHYGTWILSGLDSKENYYYRGAFADVIRAVDFVCSRPEIDTTKIAVRGNSQGGALTFASAALDKRVKVAAPGIPFLSDYPDYFKIAPWPKSDFDQYMEEHPNRSWNSIYELLTYFDIKNLASWIRCPLFMGFGVQDNVCPPHINFAAYNQVKSEKRWMACPQCTHSVNQAYQQASDQFIRDKLSVR